MPFVPTAPAMASPTIRHSRWQNDKRRRYPKMGVCLTQTKDCAPVIDDHVLLEMLTYPSVFRFLHFSSLTGARYTLQTASQENQTFIRREIWIFYASHLSTAGKTKLETLPPKAAISSTIVSEMN